MTRAEIFKIVDIGRIILPCVVALFIFWRAPRPNNVLARAAVAIVLCWALFLLYTIYLYNPAGISAGHEQGLDFPENQYDNNTVAVALIVGWFYPAFTILVFIAVLKVWQRIKHT